MTAISATFASTLSALTSVASTSAALDASSQSSLASPTSTSSPTSSSASPALTGLLSGSLTGSQQSTLSRLSGLLGIDPAALVQQLQSGGSLTALLDQGGVSSASLAGDSASGLLFDATA